MRHLIRPLLRRAFVFALVVPGLVPGHVWAKLSVVATTQDIAAITQAIGRQHVAVQSLTPGTRDPHFAEARPSMIRQVNRADLVIAVGAELEVGWLPALLGNARNARVLPGARGYLDLAAAIPLLDAPRGPVSRAMGDVHAQGNPHYWLHPENGLRMAQAIGARLSDLDPARASEYAANRAAFEKELRARFAAWRTALAPLAGKDVIAYHKSFLYLADAFGFRIVAEVEPTPGIPPNAAHLQALIERIKREDIRLLIMEPFYERRSAAYLGKQTGIKLAVLPQSVGAEAGIETYIDLFEAIVARLRESGALS